MNTPENTPLAMPPQSFSIRVGQLTEDPHDAGVLGVVDLAVTDGGGTPHLWTGVEFLADASGLVPALRGGSHQPDGGPIPPELADFAAGHVEEAVAEQFHRRRQWREAAISGQDAGGELTGEALEEAFFADETPSGGGDPKTAGAPDRRDGEVAFLRQQLQRAQENVGRMIGLAEREGATWWTKR